MSDGDAETVEVCPECFLQQFRARVGGIGRPEPETDHAYHCWQCGANFDDPAERESTSRTGLTGLPKTLEEMDADDLRAGHAVDEEGSA